MTSVIASCDTYVTYLGILVCFVTTYQFTLERRVVAYLRGTALAVNSARRLNQYLIALTFTAYMSVGYLAV